MIEQKPVPLFFAFPDGVFHFVCAECNALCCRGQGIGGNVEREMGFLLKTYPELSTMVTQRQRNLIDIATPLGCCLFLQDDNLCRIHAEHGISKKPGVCTIFPFNRFTRIGSTVFVSPHFLCPLRIEVPGRLGRVEGTHATLEASLRESAMLEPDHVASYFGASKLPRGETAKSVIERETRFRVGTSDALGRAKFMELLIASGGNRNELQLFVERAARLMAWVPAPAADSRDRIDDLMVAMAQSLLLGPRILPRDQALRVLALGERLVRTTFTSARREPQPQAVYSVMEQALPALRLLSRSDEELKLPRKVPKLPFGQPELVFAGFKLFRDLEKMGVYPALEIAFKRLTSASDRTVLANHLAAVART